MNEQQAKLMVVLFAVSIPVVFIIDAFSITSLMILKGALLKTFAVNQRQDIAMLLFEVSKYGNMLTEMFWGLWLIPFGGLVFKSHVIPRVIGILLVLNGIAYILHCCTFLLLPNYEVIIRQFATAFWIAGELSIMLWLLIKGVNAG